MSRTADPTAKIALLRAAEEVFAQKGVEPAKVEDIARAAGVSKGAFYLHFDSKEAALKQVVESFLGRMSAQFALPLHAVPETADALLTFWKERDDQSFEFLWQSRAILSILQACIGDHLYLLDAFRTECRSTAMAWLELLKNRGLVRKEADAEVVATLINGAYQELVHKLLSEKSHPNFVPWLDAAREVFVRGIGTPRLVAAIDRKKQNPRVRNGIVTGAKMAAHAEWSRKAGAKGTARRESAGKRVAQQESR